MIELIPEPELEFGLGFTHVDIRAGIMSFGPYDVQSSLRPAKIALGAVSSREDRALLENWLATSSNGIPARDSKQPNLFPLFPGLVGKSRWQTDMVIEDASELTSREIQSLAAIDDLQEFCDRVAQGFIQEAIRLTEKKPLHVLCIVVPNELLQRNFELIAKWEKRRDNGIMPDLHDILKARALTARIQTQLIWPSTIGGKSIKRPNLKIKYRQVQRQQQDEATRAWNLLTGIYYKAKGFPWRLPRDRSKVTSCYIGLGFYKNAENTNLQSAMAQVFDELGDGLILQGGPASISKTDRRPYLSAEAAKALTLQLLDAYRKEHKNFPARCVFHRRSQFKEEEVDGILEAFEEKQIDHYDLVSMRSSMMRLCRSGSYPVPRGSFMRLGEDSALLYTRGSVEYFSTYPGMYVPRGMEVRKDAGDTDIRELCEEVLSLTKMNWNNTQFDGGAPITVRAASKVGGVLRWVPAKQPVPYRYSFFM